MDIDVGSKWILPKIFFCLLILKSAFALEQTENFWPGINYQNYLTENHKFAYLIHSQLRFINTSTPLETGLVEGSVGYSLNEAQRIWVGYYWSIHNPYHSSFQENRTWQQFYWKLQDNNKNITASRTRVEEIKLTNQPERLYLARQMLANEWVAMYYGRINPLIYDEVFVPINHPSYSSNSFIGQNRLFLGVNIYSANSTSFWKVGYINQYLTATKDKGNGMNHILTVMYTFGVPKISLPVDS